MVIDPVKGCVLGSGDGDFQSGKGPDTAAGTSEGTANSRQVGGDHYRKTPGEQHWDRVARLGLDYWQAMITRYVERWRLKGGVEDLEKARHFLDKYMELIKAEVINDPTAGLIAPPVTPGGKTVLDPGSVGVRPGETPVTVVDEPYRHRRDAGGGYGVCGASYDAIRLESDPRLVTCPECLRSLAW